MQLPLASLDLNLLRILHSLVATGSTRHSADQLGMAQSSVSRGLNKLREAFGSQLFLRTPHGLEPSPLACELADTVEQMLLALDTVVVRRQAFEPASYQGELRLAVDRALLPILGPRLVSHLTTLMPLANFSVVGWSSSAQEKLLNGDYHYGIHQQPVQLPKRLHTPLLAKDPMIIIARRDHPGLSRQNSRLREQLARYPLVRMYIPMSNTLESSLTEQFLRRHHIDHRTLLKSDDFHTLQAMVEQHDAVIIGGSRLITRVSPHLACYPFEPGLIDTPEISVFAAYPAIHREQPLYQFLDQQIRSLIQSMQQEAGQTSS